MNPVRVQTEDFDLSCEVAQLRANIDGGQFDSAALLVHKVRGAAGNLSANNLNRSAGELEQLLMSGSTERLDERLQAFVADIETVLDTARAHASAASTRSRSIAR